ncbi:Niemann-Pick C1, N-terminal [Phytophthora cactorum]|nr:Niemann-Pick C1, N-terminal [Phytophthora cactorum]
MTLSPLLLVLLATASALTEAKCVMTQTCVNPDNEPDYDACIPEAHKEPADPETMTGDGWPSVIGGGNCTTATDCNSKGQCVNSACRRRLRRLRANLMSLWCGLVCSPEQDQFMHMAHEWPSTNYRQDPMTGKEKVKVLELNVALAKEMTCAIFDSCKNTAMASMAAAMKSSLGFLNYQMQAGAVGHGEYITLAFNASKDKSFDHDVLKCSNYSEVVETRETLPTQAQLLESIASKSRTTSSVLVRFPGADGRTTECNL